MGFARGGGSWIKLSLVILRGKPLSSDTASRRRRSCHRSPTAPRKDKLGKGVSLLLFSYEELRHVAELGVAGVD